MQCAHRRNAPLPPEQPGQSLDRAMWHQVAAQGAPRRGAGAEPQGCDRRGEVAAVLPGHTKGRLCPRAHRMPWGSLHKAPPNSSARPSVRTGKAGRPTGLVHTF